MKYALLLFIIFSSLRLFAQFNTGNAPQHNFFDPERDPIALRSDTTLQLLVTPGHCMFRARLQQLHHRSRQLHRLLFKYFECCFTYQSAIESANQHRGVMP